MTDNEIIKALECCIKNEFLCDSKCPGQKLDGDYREDCRISMMKISLDLINRQKAEIEKLENIERFATKTIEKQDAEIERLQKTVVDLNANLSESVNCFTRMETLYKIKCKELEVAKFEAIKEFAERLKQTKDFKTCPYVYIYEGDNLVKEMTE